MKKLLFLLLVPAVMFGQRITYTNLTGAASTDSLSTTANVVSWVESIIINTQIASDTVIVSDGGTVVATFIFGATPVAGPVAIPIHAQMDGGIVTVQRKKTSDVTVIWRRR